MRQVLGLIALLFAAAVFGADLANTKSTHSLSELSFLIGKWNCRMTVADKPDAQMSATYEWLYDGKVLKETLEAPGYSGMFLTTYDSNSNTFKGVGVGSDGTPIVWENGGMVNGKSSETGYVLGAGKLITASRTEFGKIDDHHYVIRDFTPDTPKGPGKIQDTEDCIRNR